MSAYTDYRDKCYRLIKGVPRGLAYETLVAMIKWTWLDYGGGRAYSRYVKYYEWFMKTYPTLNDQEIINGLLEDATSAVEEIVSGLNETVSGAYTDALTGVGTITNAAVEQMSQVIDTVKQTATTTYNEVLKVYDKFKETLSDDVTLLVNYIDPYIRNSIDATQQVSNEIRDEIYSVYNTALNSVSDSGERVIESIKSEHNQSVSEITGVTTEAVQKINDIQLESAGISQSMITQLKSLGSSIFTNMDDLVELMTGGVVPHLARLTALKLIPFGVEDNDDNRSVFKLIREGLFDVLNSVNNKIASLEFTIEDTAPDNMYQTAIGGLLSIIMTTISVGLYFVNSLQIANASKSERFLQAVLSNDPATAINPQDIAALNARHLVDETYARAEAKRGGYDDQRTNLIFDSAHRELSVQELFTAFNRGLISTDEYITKIGQNGYRDRDVDILDQLRLVRPGVADLVTMAVREVFSEDIASEFELFSDLPEEFVKYATEQGLSEEWAKRFWGAHWSLPSANQGFEMFHRGFIDRDTLKMLLRALDYSPYWRDKLESIAYQPLTRVDLRRIYKLGLIDTDDLHKRLMDIGYNEDNAWLMVEFYKVYTGVDDEDNTVNYGELTRTQVKKLWILGTVNNDQAIDALKAVGYGAETANLLVDSWEDEVDIEFRDAIIKKYTRKAIKESMTGVEIEVLFSELDLTATEMERVKKLIQIEIDEYDSIPTKAELRSMVEGGVIDYDTWFDYMRKHGYTTFWIQKYRELWSI